MLDLAGRIPTAAEAQAFVKSSDPHKRVAMVDKLIESHGFARHHANELNTMLMQGSGGDLRKYLLPAAADSRPWDQVFRENPASHPELLDWLARDIVEHDDDLRRLIRGLVLSKTYSRTSRWEGEKVPPPDLLSVASIRPLSPPQYATSLRLASMSPSWFPESEEFEKRVEQVENSARSFAGLIEQPGDDFQVSVTEALKRQDKRVILFWLAGGASQLEMWDPKLGRPTGGPYRAIQTCVPGIHISELMPKMSQRLGHTSIIRSLNTKFADHGGGATLMHLGRPDESTFKLPDLGAMIAREMGRIDSAVPDYVAFYTATEGRSGGTGQSGFLGARYAPMFLTTESKPADLSPPPAAKRGRVGTVGGSYSS